jgi:hypothetical protein
MLEVFLFWFEFPYFSGKAFMLWPLMSSTNSQSAVIAMSSGAKELHGASYAAPATAGSGAWHLLLPQ